MWARCAKPCAVVRRRAHCSSVVRSLGLIVTRTVGRPRFAIRASLYQKYEGRGEFVSESQIRDTSVRRTTNTVMLVLLLLVAETPIHAYLDPGAGSMVLQVVLGGVAAVGVLCKLFWRSLTEPLRKRDPGDEKQI
jgi:hypothetical protein